MLRVVCVVSSICWNTTHKEHSALSRARSVLAEWFLIPAHYPYRSTVFQPSVSRSHHQCACFISRRRLFLAAIRYDTIIHHHPLRKGRVRSRPDTGGDTATHIIMKVRFSMHSCRPIASISAAAPALMKGIRETDIRDYYVPSPITIPGSLCRPLRIPIVPLPTHRLVRRGRAS